MKITLDYGPDRATLDVPDAGLVPLDAPAGGPAADGPAALAAALESPTRYVPLRQAVTPDDRVAVVLDPGLPDAAGLLAALLDHLARGGVGPAGVTVLLPPGGDAGWRDHLPAAHREVGVEVHEPGEREKLAYLASTAAGRRVYLNRTLVDADVQVVLTGRRYDPLAGHGGGLADLYPAFGDADTRRDWAGQLSFDAPAAAAWPARREAREVAARLNPYLVQVVAGPGGTVHRVLAGAADVDADAAAAQDARWRGRVDRPAQTVVASVAGRDFDALARAAACAARAAEPEGRVVLLSDAAVGPSPAVDLLRGCETPKEALKRLKKERPDGAAAAFLWASAAAKVTLFLHARVAEDEAEELFAAPLPKAANAQRLVDAAGSCLVVPDADLRVIEVG